MCYRCEKCGKEFDKHCNYNRHINSKKTCIYIESLEDKIEKLRCPYCDKILSNTTRQKSHISVCKDKPNEIEELKKIMQCMSTKIDMQNKKIDNQSVQIVKQANQLTKLLNKETNTNTYNINQTTNQQQNVFNIVPFGEEKFDYITDKEYAKIFRAGCQSMQTFIPLIYCNKNRPENMNVYIGNFNDDSVRIFNGDGWIIERKEDVLYNMYNAKRDYLEWKYDDMHDSLSENTKYFFEKFKACNEDPETIKIIQRDIKNILYANRTNVVKNPLSRKKRNNHNSYDYYDNSNYIPDAPMFVR